MLFRAVMKLLDAMPWLKRFLSRWMYGRMARHTEEYWTFMNYGYVSLDKDDAPLSLPPADERNRYPIQLYHYIAGRVPLEGRDVLEVGSGRGGGAAFVCQYFKPGQMTAVDFADEAVALCSNIHRVPGLTFRQGDAEALPFPDASFDAVLNVESSHCYGSVPAFLAQVKRVLRPGGHFLFVDLRHAADRDRLHQQMLDSGMKIVEQRDITDNVFQSLRLDSERKAVAIAKHVDGFKANSFREFSAVEGTTMYDAFQNRTFVYCSYVLEK